MAASRPFPTSPDRPVVQLLVLASFVVASACSSSAGSGDAGAQGGSPTKSGGTTGSGGRASGGNTSSGGKTGSGGALSTGGHVATGGGTASGGAVATGGAVSTGGTTGIDGGTSGDYGFTYSIPGSNQVTCQDPGEGTLTENVPDADWLCTFHVGGKTAYVYSRAKATSAECIMTLIPVFDTLAVQLSADGVVSSLANGNYDAGGRHGNDYLQFDYQGKTYRYFHSSFNVGWHACQPMDCINIYKLGSTTLETQGCSSARTLPEVCVPIKADGTHAPLVDTFKKCPTDTSTGVTP